MKSLLMMSALASTLVFASQAHAAEPFKVKCWGSVAYVEGSPNYLVDIKAEDAQELDLSNISIQDLDLSTGGRKLISLQKIDGIMSELKVTVLRYTMAVTNEPAFAILVVGDPGAQEHKYYSATAVGTEAADLRSYNQKIDVNVRCRKIP